MNSIEDMFIKILIFFNGIFVGYCFAQLRHLKNLNNINDKLERILNKAGIKA